MNYFIGEVLVLSGAFKTSMVFGAVSILGIVLGVTYMGWLYYRVVLKNTNVQITDKLYDMNAREILMFAPLIILVFYIGVQPHVPLSYMQASVQHLLERFGAGGQEIAAVKDVVEALK
jgi:NADH-quinone oxidoreductase subunit M